MTVDEMRERKRELGLSYEQIASLSGLPISTVQKVLGGITKSPRIKTVRALEKVLGRDDHPAAERRGYEVTGMNVIRESAAAYTVKRDSGLTGLIGPADAHGRHKGNKTGGYTLDDYYALPDDFRCELIDGVIYDMAAPSFIHQMIAGEIYLSFSSMIKKHGGKCVTLIAPCDVQLDMDEDTMLQPDVMIVCDRGKLKGRVVYGAPDLTVEVLSDSTRSKDIIKKTAKYFDAGVKEYWIVDPKDEKITVYIFGGELEVRTYDRDAFVPVGIFGSGCGVDFCEVFSYIEEFVNNE